MANNFNGVDRYAKVWCSIFNDTKFVSLSLAERGAWLQLIVWAKMTGDTGIVTFRSWRGLAEVLGCDKNTAVRIVRKFAETSLVSHHDLSGIITIEIIGYNEYQRVRKTELVSDERKPADISPTNQTRPDQTKLKKEKEPGSPKGSPEVQYWVGEYQSRLGTPYVFSKKDGVVIAAVVKAIGAEEYRRAVDWLLSTSDPWYADKRTPAILRSCINQIRAKIGNSQPKREWTLDVPCPEGWK